MTPHRTIIVWDDYFHLYPHVVRFLNELSRDHIVYAIAGTNYVIHWKWGKP